MSARLLGLAFDADVPSQTAKLVLIKLVDCADDAGKRIYPSIATLARAARCADRSVQRVLALFCAAGLLRRIREGGSGPGQTTHYELNLDLLTRLTRAEWSAVTGASHDENACLPEDGPPGDAPKKGDIMSPIDPARVTIAPDKGDNECHPTPQTEPSNLRERARVRGPAGTDAGAPDAEPAAMTQTHGPDGEAGPPGTPALAEFVKAWPTSLHDNDDRVAAAWAALDFPDRRAALDGVPAFVEGLKRLKRATCIGGDAYLRNRKWLLVPEDARVAVDPARRAAVRSEALPAWGKRWWAVFWARRAAGHPVRWMWSEAGQNRPYHASAADLAQARATAAGLVNVTHDHEAAQRWWDVLRAEGLRLPFRQREQHWVYVPGTAKEGAGS